jgi:hypothetical protein
MKAPFSKTYHFPQLLHAQTFLRASSLVATRSSYNEVARADTLLTLNKTSLQYAVITDDFPLFSAFELPC